MKTNNDLTTPTGFYEAYFNLLKSFKTNEDAFNFLNAEYENIFGRKRYASYKHFALGKLI